MSNMLEQAIIDAAALREAALKNAERSIIEKYAPQIKEAVKNMLEDNQISENKRIYQGRTVSVIHEADEDGNVTVSEADGKPFMVNESELSEASDEDVLQEEEMAAATDTTTTPPNEIEAPPTWDSRYGETSSVTLTAMLDNIDDNGDIEIDLDAIELSLAQQEDAVEDTLEEDLDSLLGDLEGTDDIQLQEIIDLISEYDQDLIEEEIEVDMMATKGGTFDTSKGELEYEAEKQKAHEAHHDDEDEEDEKSEDKEKLDEALKEIDQFQETFLILKEQNKKLESVVYQLNEKLQETLLSNAKFLYQNRTLNDASLNERQKTKIVEAIGNAESPKEAKSLFETLKATVGSQSKKGPQSLSESVNHRSNLSSMLQPRQNLNESKDLDPFKEKMQKLAGIK